MSGLVTADGLPAAPMVIALATLDSPTLYVDIANLGDDIAGSSSYTTADVSKHGSRVRRKKITLLDEGTFTATMYFIPKQGAEPTHTDATNGIQPIYKRGDLRSYAIFYRDDVGSAEFFNGYISKFAKKGPIAGILTAAVEFLVDGEILIGTESGGVATAEFAPSE